VHTGADGRFELQSAAGAGAKLRITSVGFEPVELTLAEGQQSAGEIVLRPAVPAGQVRGKITDLRGGPLAATIRIEPGGHQNQVGADGSFELELAPGQYEVVIERDGFASQRRRIQIRDRGVVILNIGLSP
jgi:hypothetical protein